MSKIQEALKRLQGEGNGRSSAVREREERVRVAKIVETERPASSSNGKVIHVDMDALRTAGMIAPDYDEDLLARQFRDIKRPVLANAFGRQSADMEKSTLIAMTSALPGEGKTFSSINLALSLAQERDYQVLLVDADCAKRTASMIFDAEEEPGLMDVLDDDAASLEGCILETDIPNLSLLPAGSKRRNSTELLSSSSMTQLADQMIARSPGQIVLLDSPPILITNEAKALADVAGQIIVVVKAESTAQDAVVEALSSLDDEKPVNLLLNQVRYTAASSAYGYAYGYGSDNATEKLKPLPEKKNNGEDE